MKGNRKNNEPPPIFNYIYSIVNNVVVHVFYESDYISGMISKIAETWTNNDNNNNIDIGHTMDTNSEWNSSTPFFLLLFMFHKIIFFVFYCYIICWNLARINRIREVDNSMPVANASNSMHTIFHFDSEYKKEKREREKILIELQQIPFGCVFCL